jgi:hypothetical protein
MDRGIIQTTIETCRAIVQYAQLKCVGAVGVLTYSFFFGDIEQQIISAVICLAIFDMITGILAEVKSGKSIESKKLFKTAIKLFVYMLMISSGTPDRKCYRLRIKDRRNYNSNNCRN